uniref:Adenine DNA glycosylase n=1 Tax=Candidatus Kentrum sp. UNK TaxID=2126344 RepID=A0A451B3I9_9GAMM|nr:MAG: A/G-specific DNA-adenine glycosylase [Candidatus Kentron sp. UNK]VFK72833.1 MAG: A/G-specific DNA-adenine glycosylase [Candidatus Kentron sp. UNK]
MFSRLLGLMTFSDSVLAWHEKAGRRDLPWQRDVTAYRVWVSEIMLQQTRVGAVTEYFERFMARFPRVADLACAEPDEVLHLWSGLGYYARARNLHKAARIIHEGYGNEFPTGFEAVCALPGIGRSTAGAILALALGQRHAILDGNVKRVLARYHAIAGWPGDAVVAKRLWALAERYTPHHRVAEYTQGMMDLGAMACTRTRPSCPDCPLRAACRAYARGEQEIFPTKRPRKTLPVRGTRFMLVARMENQHPHNTETRLPIRSVLLERRPATGIWGGLWGFPECAPDEDTDAWCKAKLGGLPTDTRPLPSFRHTFTHFHLDIHPVLLSYEFVANSVFQEGIMSRFVDANGNSDDTEGVGVIWYPLDGVSGNKPVLGLAAPVARLLDACRSAMHEGRSCHGRKSVEGRGKLRSPQHED